MTRFFRRHNLRAINDFNKRIIWVNKLFIYKIDIPASPGMVYIGQTTKLLGHRWRQHKAPSSTTLIGRALQAYGERTQAYDEATIIPLCEVNTREELDALEINTIKALNTIYPHGYNLHEGGSGKRKRTAGGTSDSKEIYWDDEPEVEDDEDDRVERRGKQPPTISKIVGNIAFKYQTGKPINTYIEHIDSSRMKCKLGTIYQPSINKRKIIPRGDWVAYIERLYGNRHKEELNGTWVKVWFLSPQEYDELVETICSDFNSKQIVPME